MLGLHVQLATPEAMAYLYRASPGILVWMDWPRTYLLRQYCNWYKTKYGHKPIVITRDYEINNLSIINAVVRVRRLQQLAGDVIDYYQLTNELACNDASGLQELNTFSIQVMQQLPTVKFLLGSIAEGNPADLNAILELVPALRMAKAVGGGLALHEYSQPTMLTEATWHCGRFVRIKAVLPDDLKDILTYVTECGIDGNVVTQLFPSKPDKGWRTYTSELPYLNQVRWYNALMVANKIGGGVLFNVGSEERWKDYEHIGANMVAEYISIQQITTPVPVPPKRLYLAIVPSNQNYNEFYLSGMRTNEQVQLALYAARMLAICRTIPNITAKVFTGRPESRDTYYLSGLRDQLTTAEAWLQDQSAGVKVCLNLHTDSGEGSHIGYYWWNQGHSKMLGKAITDAMSTVFGSHTAKLNADYSDYYFVTLTKDVCTPLLLECGSHQNTHDINLLNDCGYLVARATINAILKYFSAYLTFPYAFPT